MESDLDILLQSLVAFRASVETFVQTLILPSRLVQLGVALACLALAWIVTRRAAPRLDAWMRGLDGRPKWQLRLLLLLHRRLMLIVFVGLIWAAALLFAQLYTFPSRRYLLVLIATIATAWLLIRLAAQLVRNRLLRGAIVWGLSIYAVLYYMGLLEEAGAFLDSLAIRIGDFRLSALALLSAMVVTGLVFALARVLSADLATRVRRNADISPSMQELAVKGLQVALYSLVFVIGLQTMGFDLTGLAVLSGAIGVGIGFGLQKVVSNLVSGVIILMDKSIKPGDVISLGDTFGWIGALSARYVSVVTRDGREYLIPNEDLVTGQVVNWSHSNEFVRLDIHFGTSYGDDPHLVRRVAVAAAAGVPRVLLEKAPVCHIVGFGDSSVDYILRFWITDPTGGLTNIRGNVYLALWDAFKAHGISIPFPQREVTVLPGGAFAPGGQGAAPAPGTAPRD